MGTYLPATLPFPQPSTKEEIDFWKNCAQKVLAFKTCSACGYVHHPPLPICPTCQSKTLIWKVAPETALLYSYTIVHHAVHPDIVAHVPYNVAVVLFPELNDLRLVSNVVDVTPGELEIGMPLHLVWEPCDDKMFLPRFCKGTG